MAKRDPGLGEGGGERRGGPSRSRRDDDDVGGGVPVLEEARDQPGGGARLPRLARAGLGEHEPALRGRRRPSASERGEERRDARRTPVPIEPGQDHLDLALSPRGDLVQRLDPAEERLRRGAGVRAFGEERQVEPGPPRARGQRGEEIPLGRRRREQAVDDEQVELEEVGRQRAAPGSVRRDARGPRRVEDPKLAERLLVGLERVGERAKPRRRPALEPRRGCARRLRVHLAAPQLGERRGERRGEPPVRRDLRERAAGRVPRTRRDEPFGEGRQDRTAIAGGGEDLRDEPLERRDRRAEQDAVLRVAEATRRPRRCERRRDDAEDRHGARIGPRPDAPASALPGAAGARHPV